MDLKILAEHAVIISKLFTGPGWLDTVIVTHTHTHTKSLAISIINPFFTDMCPLLGLVGWLH